MHSCPCSVGWAFWKGLGCTEQPPTPQASQIPHNPRPAFVGRKPRSKAQSQAEEVPGAQAEGKRDFSELPLYGPWCQGEANLGNLFSSSLRIVPRQPWADGQPTSSVLHMDTVPGSGPDATPSPENSPQPLSLGPTASKVGTIILLPSSITQDFDRSIKFSLTDTFQLLPDKLNKYAFWYYIVNCRNYYDSLRAAT